MARRRRATLLLICFGLLLDPSFSAPFYSEPFWSDLNADFHHLSFPAPPPSMHLFVSSLLAPRWKTAGSEQLSSKPRRSTASEMFPSALSFRGCPSDPSFARTDRRMAPLCFTWRMVSQSYRTPPVSMAGENFLLWPPFDTITGELDLQRGSTRLPLNPLFEPHELESMRDHWSLPTQTSEPLLFSPQLVRRRRWRLSLAWGGRRLLTTKTLRGEEDPRNGLHRHGLGLSIVVLFPKSISYGPTLSLSWPMSVFITYLPNPLMLRMRHFELRVRGQLSNLSSIPLFLVLWLYSSNIGSPFLPHGETFSDNYGSIITIAKSIMTSFKENLLPLFSSQWERSFPLSSPLGERTFPPTILLTRGQVFFGFLAFKPKNRIFHLTVLSSRVAVYTGPGDTTNLIAMRFGGREIYSTSQSMVTILITFGCAVNATLLSVDELGLKTAESTDVLIFANCHFSPNDLSSLIKLVSLSLILACIFLPFMYAIGPIRLEPCIL